MLFLYSLEIVVVVVVSKHNIAITNLLLPTSSMSLSMLGGGEGLGSAY